MTMGPMLAGIDILIKVIFRRFDLNSYFLILKSFDSKFHWKNGACYFRGGTGWVNSTSFHLVHYSEFKSNLILSNNPWSGHHLVHLFTGPANMSRLSLSLPYKLKMSNDFLSQAYKGVTNWMTAFIDYTSNMLAEKNTLSISFCINIFWCEDMSHELSIRAGLL